ncbi:MAG: hypothetical protein WCF84_13600, partial [Anaerolineae bacterium]
MDNSLPAASSDEDAGRAALIDQLKKLVAQDPQLAAQLADLLQKQERADTVRVSGDRAAGAGRDIVNSTIITGNVTFLSPEYANRRPDEIPPDELLCAYLRALAYECGQLPLGAVDPRFVEKGSDRQVSLPEIYVDLEVESVARARERDRPEMERPEEGKRALILDALSAAHLQRAVLLGDAGSGKTTFVHYLTFALAQLKQGVAGVETLLPEVWAQRQLLPV